VQIFGIGTQIVTGIGIVIEMELELNKIVINILVGIEIATGLQWD